MLLFALTVVSVGLLVVFMCDRVCCSFCSVCVSFAFNGFCGLVCVVWCV